MIASFDDNFLNRRSIGPSVVYLVVADFGGWLVSRATQYLRKLGERGVTSVEFAIVGPLFLMLLLAIFELGYMVFVQSVLDSSARRPLA